MTGKEVDVVARFLSVQAFFCLHLVQLYPRILFACHIANASNDYGWDELVSHVRITFLDDLARSPVISYYFLSVLETLERT